MEKSIEKTAENIKSLIASTNQGVVLDHTINSLVNTETMRDTGHAVVLTLSTKFDYPEDVLLKWKEMLGADYFHLRVRLNRIFITYYIHYDKQEA